MACYLRREAPTPHSNRSVTMKTGRNILIGAILALSGGGSILAAAAVPAVAASASMAAAPAHVTPNVYYHT